MQTIPSHSQLHNALKIPHAEERILHCVNVKVTSCIFKPNVRVKQFDFDLSIVLATVTNVRENQNSTGLGISENGAITWVVEGPRLKSGRRCS